MGMQSGASNDGPMAEINVTPFTDVLLVLLIIFMILASLNTPPGFQKELPMCGGCSDPKPMVNINVGISATGTTTIDGDRVAGVQLYDRMSEAVRRHTGRPGYSTHIALTAESATPYDAIIKVLDAARAAGDDDVGLIVP